MSENLGTAAALGFLSGNYSGTQTANAVNGFVASLRERRPTIDVNSLFAAIRELEAHIGRQDAFIEDLKRETRELREHARDVERDRNALIDWAERAEAELKRWRTGR